MRWRRQAASGEATCCGWLPGASLDLAPSFEAGLLFGASLSELGRFGEAADALDRLVGAEPDETAHQLLARERALATFHGAGGLADARRVLEEAEASVGDPVRRLLARGDLALLLVYAGRSRCWRCAMSLNRPRRACTRNCLRPPAGCGRCGRTRWPWPAGSRPRAR